MADTLTALDSELAALDAAIAAEAALDAPGALLRVLGRLDWGRETSAVIEAARADHEAARRVREGARAKVAAARLALAEARVALVGLSRPPALPGRPVSQAVLAELARTCAELDAAVGMFRAAPGGEAR